MHTTGQNPKNGALLMVNTAHPRRPTASETCPAMSKMPWCGFWEDIVVKYEVHVFSEEVLPRHLLFHVACSEEEHLMTLDSVKATLAGANLVLRTVI